MSASKNKIKKVFLIPNELAEGTADRYIPDVVKETLLSLRIIFCEDARTTRRFIGKLLKGKVIVEEYVLFELTKNTTEQQLVEQINQIEFPSEVGIISDAGCPGIADPGSLLVSWAHKQNIKVVPLPGPSSILLSVMASGLNGQSFAFNGYLPIDKTERRKRIKELERISKVAGQTQLFIETPYRNDKMLDDLIDTCEKNTLLTVSVDLTGNTEQIITKPVSQWKKGELVLGKRPAMFGFLVV
ncbi:SAM-dependent methyltransferase [Cytophaga aurantiaca]|uniref:SAM-dependent methyltransferase n=1 Tax=Cytophaga aurantiaca TaxID=29530 RepID=UPI000366E06F|nr:SAM-dependent methyltransferase [Cytophaga aurantiaca]